jgi:hypothetical protein
MIYSMGFDHNMVQHALAQAGGNQQLAINFILNGEVHAAVMASTSSTSIAAPAVSFSGPTSCVGNSFAPSVSSTSSSTPSKVLSFKALSKNPLSFPDRLTGRRESLALAADGVLQSCQQLYAHIMRPLELMQAAAWFFARQSPGMKRHREEPPPPLNYMLTEFSPCELVLVICGCVATACRRLATAPAGVHVMYRTTGRWAAWIMERVTRGRVKKVQVLLQRRACCAVRCACRASACVGCVFDACCRKRLLVLRCVAAHCSGCIKRAAAFILVYRLLLLPAFQAVATCGTRQGTFGIRLGTETAFVRFAM